MSAVVPKSIDFQLALAKIFQRQRPKMNAQDQEN
jgi:hypothetical protein